MIKIEKTEVVGWEAAIRGMRNPMNSWDKSDSKWEDIGKGMPYYEVGSNDRKLAMMLRNAGTDHRKYLRMITVYVDITAPIYWWKEFDTYKVGTVANSCSTMHKIMSKEFTSDDFSHDHIESAETFQFLLRIVDKLNDLRENYLETFAPEIKKSFWYELIQILPSSYSQKRTVMLNYEVLANQYASRKNHKLDEWHDYCHWVESLPYSELITGEAK